MRDGQAARRRRRAGPLSSAAAGAVEGALQEDDRPRARRPRPRPGPGPRSTSPGRVVMTWRSLIEPGSPSAPLATTTGSPPSARTARHFRAVGNQPPPRPRRPEAASRATISARRGRPSRAGPATANPALYGLTPRTVQACAGVRIRYHGDGRRSMRNDQYHPHRRREGQGGDGAGEGEHAPGRPPDLRAGRRLLRVLVRDGPRRGERGRPGVREGRRQGHRRPHEHEVPGETPKSTTRKT